MKLHSCYWFVLLLLFPLPTLAQEVFSLDDCIDMALRNSSDYKNARMRENIAESYVLSSYSSILPQVSFGWDGSHQYQGPLTQEYNTAVYKYDSEGKPVLDKDGNPVVIKYVKTLSETDPQSRNNFNTGVSFNQLIYDGGQWNNRVKENKNYKNSQSCEVEVARLNAITSVKQYYYELLKTRNQIIVFSEAVSLADEQLKSSESRFEIGSVAENDVLQSQVNLNEQKINLLNQQKDEDVALGNLNTILGRSVNEPIAILEDSTVCQLTVSLDEVLKFSELNNPSMRKAHYEIAMTEYSYKVSKGALLPTVSANLGYFRFNPDMEKTYTQFDKNYSLSYRLSLALPIFNGFKTKADIQYQYANMKITEENLVNIKRGVFNDVKKYYREVANNLDKITILRENLIIAGKNLQLSQGRYQLGSGILLETIDAQVKYTRSRIELVRTIYDTKIARAQLEGMAGVEDIDVLSN